MIILDYGSVVVLWHYTSIGWHIRLRLGDWNVFGSFFWTYYNIKYSSVTNETPCYSTPSIFCYRSLKFGKVFVYFFIPKSTHSKVIWAEISCIVNCTQENASFERQTREWWMVVGCFWSKERLINFRSNFLC